MATYYVDYANGSDSNNGSTGSPFKTPQRANTAASSGDTIKLRGQYFTPASLYKTMLSITKAGTTWEPDTGNAPAFDGNWSTSFQRADGDYNWPDGTCIPDIGTPGTASFKEFTTTVSITADDVTFQGIRVQNSAGQGIVATGAHRVKILNCIIDHCFGAGVVIQGNGMNDLIDGAEVGNCTITRLSFKGRIWNFAALVGKPGTQGSMNIIYCTAAHIHHNVLAYGMGEGMNAGRGGTGTIIEYNTVHTCNHLCIYINRTKNCIIRNNLLSHSYNSDFIEDKPEVKGGPVVKDQNVAAGIVIGDECGQKMPVTFYSDGQQIYNNLIIGMGAGIDIRNSYKVDARGNTDGYDTQLKNAWIAHNTIVARSRTTRGIMVAQCLPEWGGGRQHESTIIENNVVHMWYGETGYQMAVIKGAIPGVLFRNNSWYGSAAALAARPRSVIGAGDITSEPLLLNPGWPISDNYPSPVLTGLNPANYGPRETSPLIGAASNRGRANNLTPPAMAYDYNGAARSDADAGGGRYYDIGALEYGAGGGGGPAPGVAASFSATPVIGVSPLRVTFTDTSTVENGAVINRWLWEFGDGQTADTQGPHIHTYGQPGTYQARLTVMDTAQNPDIYSVSDDVPIVVTQTAPSGGAMDVVRVALRTTTGAQPVALNLDGAVPDLVLFFLTNATAAATKTDNALFAMGAASPGSQWGAAVYSRDAQATTVTKRYFSETAAVISIDHNALTGAASVTQFVANGVTLNVTAAFPAAYLLTVVAIANSAHLSKAGIIDLATATAGSLGFAPDFLAFASTFQTGAGTIGNNAILSASFGGDYLSVPASAQIAGAHLAYYSKHASADTFVQTFLGEGGYDNLNSGRWGVLNRAAADFTIDRGEGVAAVGRAGYAAISLGSNQAVIYGQTPDTTGTVAYTTNISLGDTDGDGDIELETIQPALLFIAMLLYDPENIDGETDYDSWALAIADEGATYNINVADAGNAATSDTWTRQDNSLVIRNSAGTVKAAGAISFTATGFTINWTTVNPDVSYPFYVVALCKPQSITGPVAAFSAAPLEPTDGTVTFTDQSSPNGAAITGWLWDFGDGQTATAQNPTHTYLEYGSYTVRLTVTNANGTDTLVKAGYIQFLDRANPPFLVGPYEPMTVTNYTVSRLHGDDPDSPNYGRIEIGLNLDGATIDASPADAASAVAGKVRILADLTNNRLKVILPNGTIKYLSFD